MNRKSSLKISSHLVLEENDPKSGDRVIFNSTTGHRLSISSETVKILEVFKTQATMDAAATILGLRKKEMPGFAKIVGKLIGASFLIPQHYPYAEQDTQRSVLSDDPFVVTKTGFAHSPIIHKSEVVPGSIVFCGIPVDFATTGQPGARQGPEKIREVSTRFVQYERDIFSLKGKGWYDAYSGRSVLQGVSLADVGNVAFKPSENPQLFYSRCFNAALSLFKAKGFPVFLGGDHSISAPLVKACSEIYDDIVVIQLDAHTDLADWNPAYAHYHGNVMSRILGENPEVFLCQYGIRGFAGVSFTHKRCHTLRQRELEQDLNGVLLKDLPMHKRCYLSIDVDVLDPVYAPGTGTPVPLGMSPSMLLAILDHIVKNNDVVGMDLVELSPQHDQNDMTASLVFHFLMTVLGWIKAKDIC